MKAAFMGTLNEVFLKLGTYGMQVIRPHTVKAYTNMNAKIYCHLANQRWCIKIIAPENGFGQNCILPSIAAFLPYRTQTSALIWQKLGQCWLLEHPEFDLFALSIKRTFYLPYLTFQNLRLYPVLQNCELTRTLTPVINYSIWSKTTHHSTQNMTKRQAGAYNISMEVKPLNLLITKKAEQLEQTLPPLPHFCD
jgi:hypothetical protein